MTMRRSPVFLTGLLLLSLACGFGPAVGNIFGTARPITSATATPLAASEKHCGDGVCDGPEDASTCPQDCAENGAPALEEGVYWVTNPTSGVQLYVRIIHPQEWGGEPLPALVLVPGGTGDSSDFLGPRIDKTQGMADAGFALVVFDPDGRGRSEGVEDQNGFTHQDSLAEVIRFAATLPEVDGTQIGVVSWSYGITMASGALARHPDLPVHFLIDWEGPANRDDTGGCGADAVGHLQGHPCDDEDFWSQREASTFALDLRVPYQRLQSEEDHAQPDQEHTVLMINNATAEEYGGHGKAPWTRLNDAEPNKVYTADALPPLIPEGRDVQMGMMIARYARELFAGP
jgi:pimeloyl-ACP methyl ester carboxylesterase